jgi:diguanylate cyclase (GGDEF)-like protein
MWSAGAHAGNDTGWNGLSETIFFRLPLLFEETLLGILWVWSPFLIGADLSVMSNFAQQVASALKRAQLFQEIQSLAFTDSLTGLPNRRSLFELGKIEFARSQRLDRQFCCLMLDLDHFKRINDQHGHPVGDLVLQEFARGCKESVRAADLIGRYGGEELAIFLPETDLDTGVQVAERLRESIEKMPIKFSGQVLYVTVSIGISRRDKYTLELETLIARADQALYIAKYKGRNQVAIST